MPLRIKRKGYVMLYRPSHPRRQSNGYVYEHIMIMESMVERPLRARENVHHRNGVKDDNRPENLELWERHQPYGQRVEDKVAEAIRILSIYRPELLATQIVALRAEGRRGGGIVVRA